MIADPIEIQSKPCPFCGKPNPPVIVSAADYKKWDNGRGKMIQDCFPYLTPDQRERLLTGTCQACWDKLGE